MRVSPSTWPGLRVAVLAAASLLFLTGTVSARCFGVPEGEPEDILWSVPFVARSELGDEDGGTFGVSTSASVLYEEGLDEFEPRPTEDKGLRLYFNLEQLLNFPPGKLNKSFVRVQDHLEWEMTVEHRRPGAVAVVLTWDAQQVLQSGDPIDLRLEDNATSVDMLSTSSYAFTAAQGEHAFTVVAQHREAPGDYLLLVLVVLGYGGVVALYLMLRRRRRRATEGGSPP